MADEAIEPVAPPAPVDPEQVAQKRRKAHAEIVYMEECPECHDYAVIPDQRGRDRFCMRCQWTDTE